MGQPKIKFDRFIQPALRLFKSIGMESYEQVIGKRRSYWLDLWFSVNILNMNVCMLGEMLYVVHAIMNGNNFLEATMCLTYIGVVFVGDIKILSLLRKKSTLTTVIHELSDLYPHGAQLEARHNVATFLRTYKRIIYIFLGMHFLLIWTYNLNAIVSHFIYDYLLRIREVPLQLPYYMWVPWEWRGHWSYYPLYASLVFAGYSCMNGQLACDVMLCAVTTQLIMHFQYLARSIREHVAGEAQTDQEFLKGVISYHQKILSLSESVNDVFGISLLVNFISSSLTLCFLGFQTTIGASTDILVMLLLFFSCSLLQVYMISNYSQELIMASKGIGQAVYEHDWQSADSRYKKTLILIIERSQKPTILKATAYLHISLGTVTDLLQLSYKFFALIRTMYSK